MSFENENESIQVTMLEMFSLCWARKYLGEMFDFVFMSTCREINVLLDEIKTVEELCSNANTQKVFENINIYDLQPILDRVLIIIDGLNELKDVYKFNKNNFRQLYLVSCLIDKKNGVLNNHKAIAVADQKYANSSNNNLSKHQKQLRCADSTRITY